MNDVSHLSRSSSPLTEKSSSSDTEVTPFNSRESSRASTPEADTGNASRKRTNSAIEDAEVPNSADGDGGSSKRAKEEEAEQPIPLRPSLRDAKAGPKDYRDGIPDSDSDPTDRTYDPMANLQKRHEEPGNYRVEQSAPDAAGPHQTHELGSGPYSTRKGWGGAPFIQTKAGDYNGAKVGLDYDDIARVLNHPNSIRQENMANDMLKATKDENVDFDRITKNPAYTDDEKRAMTHLMAISQVAEQHPKRTPGSAALARASLRRIKDGTSTFHQEFNRKDGNYVPAHRGGTKEMKEFVQGKLPVEKTIGSKYTAANMSDDEEGGSDPESGVRRGRNARTSEEPESSVAPRHGTQSDSPSEPSQHVKKNKGKERAE